jgi:hypothetical protein
LTVEWHFKSDGSQYFVLLRHVLLMLSFYFKMVSFIGLDCCHWNANDIDRLRAVEVSDLNHEETPIERGLILRVVEKDLLIPLRILVLFYHQSLFHQS